MTSNRRPPAEGFKPRKKLPIEAAGRTLSARNASMVSDALSKINEGASALTQLLVDANIIEAPSAPPQGWQVPLIAGALADALEATAWGISLSEILNRTSQRYVEALAQEDDSRVRAVVAQMQSLLLELIDSASGSPAGFGTMIEGDYIGDHHYGYSPASSGQDEASLAQEVERATWSRLLGRGWSLFRYEFCRHLFQAGNGTSSFDKAEGREQAKLVVSELAAFLLQHAASHVGLLNASASDVISPQFEAEAPDLEFPEDERDIEASIVSSMVGWIEVLSPIEFIPPLDDAYPIEVQASNLHPVKGILFKVDEISESPPSVGPGLPLFVPRAVAERVLNVEHLPLEASTDLSRHDRVGTCGVMTGARIEGNDFVVAGFLWQANHSEKVDAILSASRGNRKLGMSMNARAKGRTAIMAGRKVFHVDELELTGGCILFSDLATWRQTSLAAQAQADPEPWQPVAAQSQSEPEEDEPMSSLEILASHIDAINTGMQRIGDQVAEELKPVQQTVADINARLAALESYHNASIQAAAAVETQQSQQQQQTSLVEAIGEVIGQQIRAIRDELPALVSQQVRAAVNPRGVPIRPGTSAIAVAAKADDRLSPISAEAMPIMLQIASLEGQIAATTDLTTQLQLADERRNLQMSLNHL